jgi:hypothetical protein
VAPAVRAKALFRARGDAARETARARIAATTVLPAVESAVER